MLKSKLIKVDIYDAKLMLVCTDDVDAFEKKFDVSLGKEKIFAHTVWHYIKEDNVKWACVFIIANFKIKMSKKYRVTYGDLAHECFHASNMIFEMKGVRPDLSNDEPQAYLIKWIMNQCIKYFTDELKVL